MKPVDPLALRALRAGYHGARLRIAHNRRFWANRAEIDGVYTDKYLDLVKAAGRAALVTERRFAHMIRSRKTANGENTL